MESALVRYFNTHESLTYQKSHSFAYWFVLTRLLRSLVRFLMLQQLVRKLNMWIDKEHKSQHRLLDCKLNSTIRSRWRLPFGLPKHHREPRLCIKIRELNSPITEKTKCYVTCIRFANKMFGAQCHSEQRNHSR